MKSILPGYRIILGSASPRRQMLMREAGLEFELRLSDMEEDYPHSLSLEEIPEYLAEKKANALKKTLHLDEILITADTVVILEGKILGKPSDRDDAIEMLTRLSGKKHTVITGVCILSKDFSEVFSSATDVYFRELSREDIVYYVDHYKPFDKAGAYGIQEWIGYIGIERIDGSFYNVMGLPVNLLYHKLRNIV